jgi:outer membrane protein assembly factor BamB
VALSYPNSTIWGTAAFAAIDGYERVGLYPQALQLLRYVYAIVAPDNVHDRVVILQKMAADYMQIPGRVEVALGRLEAADELERTAGLLTPFRLAGGKILPIGTPVIAAINELVHALPDQGAAETARLAAFGFPSSLADRDYYQKNHVHPQPLLPEDPATAIPNVTALLAPDQPYARYDRVVAWTAGAGLSIYPVGSTHPLGTNPDARTEPRGTAWVASKSDPIKSDAPKSDLLAWNSASLTLIGGEDARTRWTVDMLSQPALDVMAPRPVPPKYEALVPQQQMPFGGPFGGGFGRGFGRGGRNRQGLLINGQQIFQRQATQSAGAASAATDAADDSIETIAAVRPVAGLAIVSTTAGRIMAVDLAAGAVRWQVRVSTHALDRLEATDDFTVLKTTDDPNGLIMALDTVTGRLIWHRSFGGEDQIAEPVNFALGQDGRLAFTTTDQLFIVQLFEAMRLSDPQGGMVPPTPQQAGAEPFARMDQPGQLLVTDGQVLAIGIENGQYELFDYNAETGQPRILGNGETNLRLDNCDEKTVLQPAGAYVYAWCPKAIAAHNLENPALGWQQSFQGRADARQLLLGRDYLVVMGRAPGDDVAQTWTLTAYLRSTPTIPSGAESGRIVYTPSITNTAGIVAFQMIDGGLCYLSNDHVLHTLTANRNPTPPTAPTPPTPPTAP